MSDVLELTYSDHVNYRALCAAIEDIPWKAGSRRYSRDTLSSGAVLRKLYEQDYKCAHCGARFKFNGKRFIDTTTEHVIPFRYGSKANVHNTLLMNIKCNRDRSSMDVVKLIEDHYGPINYGMVETFIQPPTYNEFMQ